MKTSLTVLLTGFCLTGWGRSFYISTAGSDRATGRTPHTAWKTLERLSAITFQPGDTVFFQRGCAFSGSLRLRQSGSAARPIVITAYGTGPKPVLTGAVTPTGWQRIGENKYEAQVSFPVRDVFVDDHRQTPARFPNNGFLLIDEGFGKDSISCRALTQPDGYWKGAMLRLRTIDWAYETRTVGQHTKGLLIQERQVRYEIEKGFEERTQRGKVGVYPFRKGYGFYLEGLLDLVDSTSEWSWQAGRLRMQLPAGKRPEDIHIQVSVRDYGLWLASNVQYVRIQNVQLEKYEKAGIAGGHHLRAVSIEQNTLRQIHGVGILLDSASSDCTVRMNTLTDVLGRGIAALEPVRLDIAYNTIKTIGLVRAQGWTGVNGATGILIHNIERTKQTDTTYAHHNTIRHNRVDSCGYNGIRVDGHHNLVENNVIEHCGLTLNDGANLYCYAKATEVTHHSVFRQNIIRYGVGDNQGTPANNIMVFGIYLDNNSHDILVEGNTIVSISSTGLVNNDASFRNTFRQNTVFDCREGIGFSEWANLGKIHSCVTEDNLFVATRPDQYAVSLKNYIGPTLEVGRFDRNTYINLAASQLFYIETKQVPANSKLSLPFAYWKKITGEDTNSRAITALSLLFHDCKPLLLVNDTINEKEFPLQEASYFDLNGKVISGTSRLLKPFESRVVMQKNSKL